MHARTRAAHPHIRTHARTHARTHTVRTISIFCGCKSVSKKRNNKTDIDRRRKKVIDKKTDTQIQTDEEKVNRQKDRHSVIDRRRKKVIDKKIDTDRYRLTKKKVNRQKDRHREKR